MRKRGSIALLVMMLGTGLALAAGTGFSRLFALPADGTLTVRNTQKNEVWRPCVLSVLCPSSSARTVTVYRVVGELEYPIARQAATAQTYVYEFEANYWCDFSNGVKVVVSPACTGIVEVIYE